MVDKHLKFYSVIGVLLVYSYLTHAQNTWISCSSGSTQDFQAVFVNADGIGSVAGFATIIHTTDGAHSFSDPLFAVSPTDWMYDISVSPTNQDVLYASGLGGFVLKSWDRGVSWFDYSILWNFRGYANFFIDDSLGWVGGSDGHMFMTEDGGGTWVQVLGNPFGGQHIFELHFKDDMTGFASGNAGLFRTLNGGQSWSSIGSFDNLNCSSFPSDSVAYFAGIFGTIIRSSNGGWTWSTLPAPNDLIIYDIEFVTEDVGWICGENFSNEGKIYSTTDGGLNWTEEIVPTGIPLMKELSFIDSTVGFAVGSQGTILRLGTLNVGLENNNKAERLEIKCHYTNNHLQIACLECVNASFQIFSGSNGRMDVEGTLEQTHSTINIQNAPSGLYVLVVKAEGVVTNQKFLVVK